MFRTLDEVRAFFTPQLCSKYGIKIDVVSDKRVCYHIIELPRNKSRVLRFKFNRAGKIELKLVGTWNNGDHTGGVNQSVMNTPELLLAATEREIRLVVERANKDA